MDRKTQLFNRFAEANSLERMVSFAAKQQKFRGLDRDALLMEEWMRTIEFTGFVDGYEGHPHKYKGPTGSPDAEFTVSTREVFLEPVQREESWFSRIKRRIRPELQAYHIEVRSQNGTPQVRKYDQQYQLGQSVQKCRGNNHDTIR